MDTHLFRIQPPKQAMLREATITSGIIATFIGAPFFFFPYVDEDRISFTASITSLVVIYIVALIYLSLCVGWFTDYYTTGKKTIFEVDRKNLTIHQDGESTPYRLVDLHIDHLRGQGSEDAGEREHMSDASSRGGVDVKEPPRAIDKTPMEKHLDVWAGDGDTPTPPPAPEARYGDDIIDL